MLDFTQTTATAPRQTNIDWLDEHYYELIGVKNPKNYENKKIK